MTQPIVGTVEKVMSLTAAEFTAGLEHLGGGAERPDGTHVVTLQPGAAVLSFSELPGVRLGGLLALPRARVVIAFEGASPEARANFLRRFELAFQRGGG